MNLIEKARSLPSGQKNKVAVIAAAALTVLIVSIWFVARRGEMGDEAVKSRSTAESLKPLFMIFNGAKKDFKEIKSDADTYRAETKAEKEASQ